MELLLASGSQQELVAFELRLRSLGNRLRSALSGTDDAGVDSPIESVDDFDDVSDDEIFELIDKEIGMA